MTTLEALLDAAALRAVGWALIHFLWQGAAVAALYAAFAALAKRASASVRYAGGVAALALMLTLPALTAGLATRSPRGLFAGDTMATELALTDTARERARATREASAPAASAAETVAAGDAASGESLRMWAQSRLSSLVPWMVFGWLVGVACFGSRLLGGWLLVLRLRRSAAPVAERFEELLSRVSERLRVRGAVRLCRSALVEVPTVVGHLRPVILIPASALTGLTPAQLEAVLAHELAHIRRHDYLVNLLQTTAETLLFYHPAVWWVSGRVRVEREHACDDAAVEAVRGDVLLYARSLAALEQLRSSQAGASAALALAADGGSLMQRIQRLVGLNKDSGQSRSRARTPLAAAALLGLAFCAALAGGRSLVPEGLGEASAAGADRAEKPRREVAVTFVTFPGNNIYSDIRVTNKTRKLMRQLAAEQIKAVAFVNESRLYKESGALDEVRVNLLREWLDAGHELGNETFTHKSLYNSTVAEFRAEIVQGEQISARLMQERGRNLRYFSYPYLNTGQTLEAKSAVENILRQRGYQIHPVTIDNMDWLFGQAYIEALRREDEAGAAAIRAEYVPYMERLFEFYEGYSREVVGREFPQVLMLTAGALNADAFGELAAMMKRRGYKFVTMEQALKDEAYSQPDNYTGAVGNSWIARWAATKGLQYKDPEEDFLPASMQEFLTVFKQRWKTAKAAEDKKK